jgi:para-nitrobenzyl esterase
MPMGASHGSELGYVFQRRGSSLTASQHALSDRMIGYWTSFAATGIPAGRGAPAWPRYSNANDQVMELKPSGPGPSAGFAQDHNCVFWAPLLPSIQFDGVAG